MPTLPERINCKFCWIKLNMSKAYQEKHCPGCSRISPGGRPLPGDKDYLFHQILFKEKNEQ